MNIVPDCTLMRIYVAESERTRGKPAHLAIVEALKDRGLRGAIVFKGIQGFGSHRRVSSSQTVDGLVDSPILIEVVDEADRIASFVSDLDALLLDGLVTLERIRIVPITAERPAVSGKEAE